MKGRPGRSTALSRLAVRMSRLTYASRQASVKEPARNIVHGRVEVVEIAGVAARRLRMSKILFDADREAEQVVAASARRPAQLQVV